jgi:hypothetical protein
MESELEKIDLIRSRFRIGYDDARQRLEAASGDVIAVLAALEKEQPDGSKPDLLALGADVADEVQRLIGGGPIRKLRVRYGGKPIKEIPVALTAAAALAVGLAAVLISKLVIEVEKGEEEGAA